MLRSACVTPLSNRPVEGQPESPLAQTRATLGATLALENGILSEKPQDPKSDGRADLDRCDTDLALLGSSTVGECP